MHKIQYLPIDVRSISVNTSAQNFNTDGKRRLVDIVLSIRFSVKYTSVLRIASIGQRDFILHSAIYCFRKSCNVSSVFAL